MAAYFLLPLDRPFGAATALGLIGGLLVVGALVVWQTRSIVRSPYPRLKAVEALATSVPLFILLFAAAYYLMARSQSVSFTQPLSRMDAVYFTVTVFSTVGFGDIVPTDEAARALVVLQMLGDLVFVGVAARVILGAVNVGLDRSNRPAFTDIVPPPGVAGTDDGTAGPGSSG
ncbi:potassium channel family protein [Streptomyces sp. SP17BM10]|uniref:potassium channel family protein n=1 Tax=Streptomyces sp. SP17BM10 TaxID=3002530 RepID=UPI002E798515|nr:potassium channel family protein [Streptomyces sp. SP17BM10]MEE1786336.1 potassium channel family protein [Streptomyces sp. SP17BM10]